MSLFRYEVLDFADRLELALCELRYEYNHVGFLSDDFVLDVAQRWTTSEWDEDEGWVGDDYVVLTAHLFAMLTTEDDDEGGW